MGTLRLRGVIGSGPVVLDVSDDADAPDTLPLSSLDRSWFAAVASLTALRPN